jgi:hypothetical protein
MPHNQHASLANDFYDVGSFNKCAPTSIRAGTRGHLQGRRNKHGVRGEPQIFQ